MTRYAPLLALLLGCGSPASTNAAPTADDVVMEGAPVAKGQAEAIVAGGCFWCMESSLEAVPGILEVESGYSGGKDKPTYKAVGSGRTGHYEVVRIIYDPKKLTYDDVLEHVWVNIDPFQANGQFCDMGPQYRAALFPGTPQEKKAAMASKAAKEKLLGKPIVTEILDKQTFWLAEGYHQDFYKKNPAHYLRYRRGCGRDNRLAEVWGDAAKGH